MKKRNFINNASAIVLGIFALLTLVLSSSVIFDWLGMRAKEGNYVLFIVWVNFVASIFYFIAVYGFAKRRKWTFWALIVALIILITAFISLQIHINDGGIYESKTVKAMIFRMMVTLIFSIVAYFNLKNPKLITKSKG